MNGWTPPTVAQFQAQFVRDWQYAPAGDTSLKYIQNQDIQNAINLAVVDFNSCLFGDNATTIFLYLAAHYLVVTLRNSSMGINSQPKFPLLATSVAGVSIQNNITDWVANNPQLNKYLKTGYGQIYLDMVFPYTIGGGFQFVGGGVSTN